MRKMKYKLKDIFDLQMGKTPSRDNVDYWNTNDYKWISIGDLSTTEMYISNTKEHLSEKAVQESRIKLIPRNTVVMSFKLSIGKTAITAEDMYSNEAIMAFHDKHVVDMLPKYIFYLFKYRDWDKGSNKAVMGKTLNKATLSEIEIELCSLEKQKEIVKVLDKITGSLAGRKSELLLLDDLIKARFVEMFGNITTGNYKYHTKKLGDVANVGSSHRVFTTEFVESGIPFYRGTEIGELASGIKPTEPYYISEEHYNRLANDDTKPQIGDLLMPSICNKGQVWMVDTDEPFYYKDGRVLCISPDREVFDTKYLEYFMRAKTLVEYPKIGSGSTFAEFKIFLLKDIDVLIPPRNTQEQFSNFVRATDKSKVAVQKALDETQTLFDSLMQEYFG